MKYIKTYCDTSGLYEIFVFPTTVNHDAFMESLERLRNQTYGNWSRLNRTAISAGFVDSNFNCYGNSESLNLVSFPEDTILLRQQILR